MNSESLTEVQVNRDESVVQCNEFTSVECKGFIRIHLKTSDSAALQLFTCPIGLVGPVHEYIKQTKLGLSFSLNLTD